MKTEKSVLVRIDSKVRKMLKITATNRDITSYRLINEIIKQWMQKHEPKIKRRIDREKE